MTATSSLTLRAFDDRDEPAVLEAWGRATGAGEHRPDGRSEALWRWQYRDAPDGFRWHLALDADERVLAQIGGMPRRVAVGDDVVSWLAVTEVLNDTTHPDGLGRHVPVLRCAEAFLREHGGIDRHPLMYGLPNRGVFRLAFARAGAEAVRNQNKLCLVPKALRGDFDHDVTVEEASGFAEEVDGLFERARGRYGAIGVRDVRYLSWRFPARPDRAYRIGLARDGGGRLVGYAVFCRGRFDGRDDGLVADWLVDPEVPAAGHALRRWLAERTEETEAELLTTVIPDTCPEWLEFQHAGFRLQPTADYLMARAWQRPYDIVWAHRHWYYTLADLGRC